MMAKPMKTLELHYPMIQFLIITGNHLNSSLITCGRNVKMFNDVVNKRFHISVVDLRNAA